MGWIGLLSVTVFSVAFTVCGLLNPDFDLLRDHISKLGASGQPNAVFWNWIGFVFTGLGLAAFGWLLGSSYRDRLLGSCLVVSGFGFALGAIPTDFDSPDSPASKAHFVAICFSLAGWFFALARLAQSPSSDEVTRKSVTYTMTLTLPPLLAQGGGMIAEAVTHRLLLAIIFGWVTFFSVRALLHPLRASAELNQAPVRPEAE